MYNPKDLNKKFLFYTSERIAFEKWDYMNPILKGIGGSETSQIEMSSRLATRHHNVTSYAPVPWYKEDKSRVHRNAIWINSDDADFDEDGIWVVYRDPVALDDFSSIDGQTQKGQEIWFVAQDVFYSEMTEERAEKISKYICLCVDHANYCAFKYPYLADKILISSNGINVDLINGIAQNNIKRNPHRILYSSSPDRGLEQLLPIFQKAREFVPDLELHVFYGFDNIDKIIDRMPWVARIKDSIMGKINATDGVHWHGRIGQIELLTEWFQSGLWVYPVNFTETSCISCMEAQACGVIPIASPVWALRENIMHGILIPGSIEEKLTLSRFVGEIIRVCNSEKFRDELLHKDGDMIMQAKVRFNWERYVDQWEKWIYQPECPYFFCQFAFQHKYAFGNILNVGCDVDSSDFRGTRKATNLDVQQNEKGTVDLILDLRKDPYINPQFDTVIVGDMIEHMEFDDGIRILKTAKRALRDENSILIITCPSDPRPRHIQNPTMDVDLKYPGGVSCFHRYIQADEFDTILNKAGLKVLLAQDLDYTHFKGWGVICR